MQRFLRAAVTAAAALATLAVTEPAAAQQDGGVAGTWRIEVERMVRNSNGQESTGEKVIVHLTMEARGDSVFGTWQVVEPAMDPMPRARQLKGTFADGVLTLVGEVSEARIMGPDGETRLPMRTTYSLKLDGDTLAGTQQSAAMDGSRTMPARPITAKRLK
jgi:hypothetical protein